MIHKEDDPRKAMKVPEGFFENFEDRLMSKIYQQEVKESPLVKQFWSVRRLTTIAACFVVIIVGLFAIRANLSKTTPEMGELSLDYDWSYILEHSEDFTYDEISEFEEADEVLDALENELFGQKVTTDYIENIDLEILELEYE